MPFSPRLILSALASLGVAACTLDDPPATSTDPAAILACPSWGCGGNTPVIADWPFHDLHPDGRANSAGVRLLGMLSHGHRYVPSVTGARLIGVSTRPASYPSIENGDLVGAELVLQMPDSSMYSIRIRGVSDVTPYWLGDPTPNQTYELTYGELGLANDQPLCHNPPGVDDVDGGEWPRTLEALIFAGDRYDADAKTVFATGAEAGDWFNIACAGSALAKLHLNRFTEAGSDATHATSAAQRQALLKMYVADVCGTGQSFTRAGEPLRWADDQRWRKLPGREASFEAMWSADGATCLDEFRLEADPAYYGIRDQIDTACAAVGKHLTDCAAPGDFSRHEHIASANP